MYLFGASGHAKVIIDILKSRGQTVSGIFDDNILIKKLLEFSVLGKYDPGIVRNEKIIISIGDNKIRSLVAEKISSEFGVAIHKTACISDYSSIGVGTVVMHNAVIQSSVVIGKHVIINTSAIVEHDCQIEDFVHISPNVTLCGNVKIGQGTHIGAGATIIPGINIGEWSIIGAGSIIIEDVPDNVVIVGNPGKIINNLKE
jgi:sugar O-acyltransferase (sialic acid O-acetyltransferase NeuD family)